MILSAFTPQGNTITFTADTVSPSPVQANTGVGLGSVQYEILNAGNVTVFMGIGITSGGASTNATVVTSSGPSYPLLPGTDKIITGPPNAYFTGITSSGNAVIYITPGEGL